MIVFLVLIYAFYYCTDGRSVKLLTKVVRETDMWPQSILLRIAYTKCNRTPKARNPDGHSMYQLHSPSTWG